MDCAEIRDAFVQGTVLPSARVEEHLRGCPQCTELFARDAKLGRSLAAQAAPLPQVPGELFAKIETRVAGEIGLRAWLRSRPTWQRFVVMALSVLSIAILGGFLRRRPDFGSYPFSRLIVLLSLYLLGILVAFRKELVVSARRGSLADHSGLLVAALGLPFLIAFVPATDASRAFGPEGGLGCFTYGALLTLPTALLLWAFDRDDRLSVRTVCLSAAALGLSANLVLELHCPSGNLFHLLLGHASIGLAWLLAWALTRRLGRA